jgi:hypothetical protein
MPDTYNLALTFTDEQLKALYVTGSKVIIAKPIGGSVANVAWQAFQPMAANAISWEEKYGIYVSASEVVHGSQLLQNAATGNAQADTLYTIEANGVITNNSQGGYKDAYSLLNNYDDKPYMTVGLYQGATVNGLTIPNNAVSATAILLKSTAVMTPGTALYIWILSQVDSNTVVTTITSPTTQLVFGDGISSISVVYNSRTGMFMAV